MPRPQVRYRRAAFPEIRRLGTVKRILLDFAKDGADAGGDGFVAHASDGATRARAAVIAVSMEARRRNAREHTLVGPCMDAMRR